MPNEADHDSILDDPQGYLDSNKPGKRKKIPPEVFIEYAEKILQMIASRRKFYDTFTKDISLEFKVSRHRTFFLEPDPGIVNLSVRWFLERRFTLEQINWAVLHELSHFRDMADDPNGWAQGLEHVHRLSKKTGHIMMKKWEAKYAEVDPKFIEDIKKQRPARGKDPAKTSSRVEDVAYKFHWNFHTILMDVYVNNAVARRAPNYEEGTNGQGEIRRLYQEKLFPKLDYTKSPHHLQFLDALLREEMVSGESVIVSEEVREALNRKIRFQGKDYTPREILQNFIKPGRNKDTRYSKRLMVLQYTLEPIYTELLMKDLESWDPKKPEEQEGDEDDKNTGEEEEDIESDGGFDIPSEGKNDKDAEDDENKGKGDRSEDEDDLNPFGKDYKDTAENSLDQLNQDEVEKWLDKYNKEREKKEEQAQRQDEEDKKTSEQKAKEAQEKLDREWANKNKVSFDTLRSFRKIEYEISTFLSDFSNFWKRIIYGSSRFYEKLTGGRYTTGIDIDIQEAINEWAKIIGLNFDQAEIMTRIILKEGIINKPELIRVRVVGDISGSMDTPKLHILQQCIVLILSSLKEFDTYLNLTRSQTKSKLSVDTEAWVFSSGAEIVKRQKREIGAYDEQAEIVRVYEKLTKASGSTADNIPLEQILSSLSDEDRRKIMEKKIMEIVFLVTDGGSNDPILTRQAVDKLLEVGVVVRGFQIGAVSPDEKKSFQLVWNAGRKQRLGMMVGKNINKLIPQTAKLLKEHLSGVIV